MPWISVAGLMGVVGVGLGAIGAHMVDPDPTVQRWFQTAVSYHMYHIAGIVAVAVVASHAQRGAWAAHLAGVLMTLGVLLFSGSLYVMSFTSGAITGGVATPAGGMLLIAGWLCLVVAGLRHRSISLG